jgi:phage portal protein BeeE
MNLVPWKRKTEIVERDSYPLNFQDWVDYVNYNGTFYPLSGMQQTLKGNREEINDSYMGLATRAYRSNAVVHACMLTRLSHFTEARLIYRQRVKGRPGDLFGTPDLQILETPWPGATTGDLLGRMIQDADLAGNFYGVKVNGRIARLRPDRVALVLGSRSKRDSWVAGDPDTEVAAYLYFPGGKTSGEDPMIFAPSEVAHFAPNPDPLSFFVGMSWLTSLIREMQADSLMTEHKTKFLEQGATPNLIVTIPEGVTQDNFNAVVETIRRDHEGARNAYKTLFLAGGADAKAVGVDMQQSDFRAVQGAGETRIAAAARVPPVIVGISEGLQGSSLNSGNYQAARRMFADGELRRLWRNAAGSLAKLVTVPGGAELWYDDRDIAFLKEDLRDVADVRKTEAETLHTYISAGFEPDSAINATKSGDISLLAHTGLFSVQLQPAGSVTEGKGALLGGTVVPSNGKGTAVPQLKP